MNSASKAPFERFDVAVLQRLQKRVSRVAFFQSRCSLQLFVLLFQFWSITTIKQFATVEAADGSSIAAETLVGGRVCKCGVELLREHKSIAMWE